MPFFHEDPSDEKFSPIDRKFAAEYIKHIEDRLDAVEGFISDTIGYAPNVDIAANDQATSKIERYTYDELSQMVADQSVQIDILQRERKDDLDTLRNFLGDMSLEHPIGRVIRRCQDVEKERDWANAKIEAMRTIVDPIYEGLPLPAEITTAYRAAREAGK